MKTIGLLLTSSGDIFERDIIKGACSALAGKPYRLLCIVGGNVDLRHGDQNISTLLYDLIQPGGVDALIVPASLCNHLDSAAFEAFCQRFAPIPMVSLGLQVPTLPSVITNNYDSMASLMDHLLVHHGLTRLAFVGGPRGQQEAEQRKAAFLDKLAASAQSANPVNPAWIVHGDFEHASGVAAADTLLKLWEATPAAERFQGIVVANDLMALGVVEQCRALGIRVPQDLVVTGFDDMIDSRAFEPPLTTLFQAPIELARHAAKLAMALIEGLSVPPLTVLSAQLQVRQSCGCGEPDWAQESPQRLLAEFQAAQSNLHQVGRELGGTWELLHMLRSMTDTLHGGDSYHSMRELVAGNLIQLGYPGFWIALYEEACHRDATNPMRLRLHKEPDQASAAFQHEASFYPIAFLAEKLANLPEGNQLLVLEALHFRLELLGFILLVTDPERSFISGTLAGQISGAVNAVLLLDERRRSQRQLIQSEKLAALGALVAGVAHEVALPLNKAMAGADLLKQTGAQLIGQYRSGTATREQVSALLGQLSDSVKSIQSNLSSSADLVSNFKKISADQVGEERRCFNLKEYIVEVLASQQFLWKNRPIDVILEGRNDIEMDSWPGAIAQIITHFIANTLLHGFPADSGGTIRIDMVERGQSILLCYADNGCGISVNDQDKIFQPFFTTRREYGSIGLGLHIVFNLVTTVLGGSISFNSSAANGLRFEIHLPRHAPTGAQGLKSILQ